MIFAQRSVTLLSLSRSSHSGHTSHVTQRDVVTSEREEQGDYRLQITVAEERGEEY